MKVGQKQEHEVASPSRLRERDGPNHQTGKDSNTEECRICNMLYYSTTLLSFSVEFPSPPIGSSSSSSPCWISISRSRSTADASASCSDTSTSSPVAFNRAWKSWAW
uniref:Uncharacterized protein n=1 Tax=Bionectria ochroleuca TaxID=29856 RepID=A0A8H7TTH9_BIOOC